MTPVPQDAVEAPLGEYEEAHGGNEGAVPQQDDGVDEGEDQLADSHHALYEDDALARRSRELRGHYIELLRLINAPLDLRIFFCQNMMLISIMIMILS